MDPYQSPCLDRRLSHAQRPTLAFLTPYLPYPPDTGGKNRTFNILQTLAKHFTVDLCSVCEVHQPPDPGPLNGLCRSVNQIYVRPGRVQWGWRHCLLSKDAVSVESFYSRPALSNAAQALSHFCHDLIFVDEVVMTPYLRYLPPFVPYVIGFQKVDYTYYQDVAAHATGRLRLYYAAEAIKLRHFAQRALQRAAATVVCSLPDANELKQLAPSVPSIVLPNGVDTEYFRPRAETPPGPPTILYVGTMSYGPNVDALMYFLREIHGRIVAELPDVRLVVVGKDPVPAVKSLSRPPQITITGSVDDVRPYYDGATVSAVPLRIGGGTRLKILESFAMGVPVVATTIAMQGIDARHGEDLLVADDPASFAAMIVQLIRNPALQRQLAANGRRLVETRYSWPSLVDGLTSRLCDLLSDLNKGSAAQGAP